MKKIVKIGPIEFNHYSIKAPTVELVNAWIKDILPTFNSFNLDVYILAGFINKPKQTRDVDIVFLGDITYRDCYALLKKAYELAFYKYKFNLDMQWYSCLLPEYKKEFKKSVTKLRLMNKVTINKRIIWDRRQESEEVYSGLFKITEKMPSPKQLKYMKEGLIYSSPIKLESDKSLILKNNKVYCE